MQSKNIVLVGMMGSGKTTIGKLIADNLKEFTFVDIDSLIEQKENRNINDIFKDSDEVYFRKVESEIVKELSNSRNLVISTGGGIVKNSDNIKFLKENGRVIYLSASSDVLYERLKDFNDRPLLNKPDIKATIDNLLNERENLYKTADYEINTNFKSPGEIANEVIEICKRHE